MKQQHIKTLMHLSWQIKVQNTEENTLPAMIRSCSYYSMEPKLLKLITGLRKVVEVVMRNMSADSRPNAKIQGGLWNCRSVFVVLFFLCVMDES